MDERVNMVREPPAFGCMRSPTVVIPIHDAPEVLERCVESVLRHTPGTASILAIDDASSDPAVSEVLERASEIRSNLDIRRNHRQLGYIKTVNVGLSESRPQGAILLNSDTVVASGWYERLVAAGESSPSVATVTPVSNCAGPFSVPWSGHCASLPVGISVDEFAALVERVSPGSRPRAPTGHGFCMYVRWEAIEVVGLFDDERFGRGYGEENDFCVRASRAGFIHLVEDSTFVYHEGGSSFGRWLKPLRKWLAYIRLCRLHPEYQGQVAEFLEHDPLAELRRRVLSELEQRGLPA
jgi:GT2 family glycosyltransferase